MNNTLLYLSIKKSINGLGIFTMKEIKHGETIFEVTGKIMSIEEIESNGIFSKLSANAYRFDKKSYISPKNELGDFLNHSCNPNSYVHKENDKLFIKAIQKISSNSEITIDYSTIMASDDEWEMNCNCKSRKCRKTIKKFNLLPTHLKKKYIQMNIVPDYIIDN